MSKKEFMLFLISVVIIFWLAVQLDPSAAQQVAEPPAAAYFTAW
jgi:hypothetical protein